MAQDFDQAARRRPVILRDRWDRRWESTLDFMGPNGGGTCAPINPKGWVDILNTPVKYKREYFDEGTLKLNIDVDQWITDLEEAHKNYDQKLYTDAMMLFGAEGPQAYEERSPALTNYTGPAPQPLEPIYALKDGNSWILGKTTTPDPRLTKYFVKQDRVRPSFRDEDLDLEEQHDPEAKGGKKVPIKTGGKRLAEEAA